MPSCQCLTLNLIFSIFVVCAGKFVRVNIFDIEKYYVWFCGVNSNRVGSLFLSFGREMSELKMKNGCGNGCFCRRAGGLLWGFRGKNEWWSLVFYKPKHHGQSLQNAITISRAYVENYNDFNQICAQALGSTQQNELRVGDGGGGREATGVLGRAVKDIIAING